MRMIMIMFMIYASVNERRPTAADISAPLICTFHIIFPTEMFAVVSVDHGRLVLIPINRHMLRCRSFSATYRDRFCSTFYMKLHPVAVVES